MGIGGAAKVSTFEKSYAMRVSSTGGVYNSILIPAKKGPISTPVLISSEDQLLRLFTPNRKVEVGYNMAYYSALAVLDSADKLWVTRIANGALRGGVEIFDDSKATAWKQVNETSPEMKLITFSVEGITDGGTSVTVTSITNAIEADLNGRQINIEGISGSYEVTAVNGSVLTLGSAITSSVSFSGAGAGTIGKSVDYIGFDADFGAGGNSTDVIVSNLTTGLPSDMLNASITFLADGTPFTRTVIAVSSSTLTLDAVSPAITVQNGTGYKGTPDITVSVSGIVDGGETVQLAGINPTHLTTTDIDGMTLDILAEMSDNSTLALSSVVSAPVGSTMTVVAFNNPSLVDTATAKAPYAEAVAVGYEDDTSVNMTDACFALSAADGGEWSKDIRIEILKGVQVREPNAFEIRVFGKNDLNTPLESFICNRIPGSKNGKGRNMYIENALERSTLISAVDNTLVDQATLPTETVERDVDGKIVKRNFIKLVAGDDGDAVTDSNMITGLDLLDNKNSYPISVMLDGGWASPAYQIKMAQVCEKRDDCVAILSVPFEKEITTTYATDIVNYRNLEVNINSSYAAMYSCHVKITDKFNDREIFVSPDGYAAAAINYSASNYEIWYPAAGFKRGRLFVNDVLKKFTDGDLDFLAENGINTIRFAPGKGIAIWGQYTMTHQATALDRLNIRLLLNEIKPAITEFLDDFLFELNTNDIRILIQSKIESYLFGIRSRNGIEAFDVVCNDSNNSDHDKENHVLNVDVYIKPVQSIEYINFTTILTTSGIEFLNI